MARLARPWDYLLVTASNDRQAAAYRARLDLEARLGLLANFRRVLVVADPEGRRIGSGGSTILCLMEVLNSEPAESGTGESRSPRGVNDPEAWMQAFAKLRILIVHAGGDSKRVPAYSAAGKILMPMPIESDTAVAPTLFDRQLPAYRDLPSMPPGAGQVVVTCGDALLCFDPDEVEPAARGVTFVACHESPAVASRHGVYCVGEDRRLTVYLQKPSIDEQRRRGAIDFRGRSILDIGVMNFDAATSAAMIGCFDTAVGGDGRLRWSDAVLGRVLENGFDLYSDICGALGTQATLEHYRAVCRATGSKWTDADLARWFERLRPIPAEVQVLGRCGFLHFGTTRQLITSGASLVQHDRGFTPTPAQLLINNRISAEGRVTGDAYWVEGCEIEAPLDLDGQNVVTGARIESPLRLPKGACLSVIPGRTRAGEPCRFVLCYGSDDQFKDTPEEGATFCNRPVLEWMQSAGARPENVWGNAAAKGRIALWDARVSPAIGPDDDFRQWLWMFDPLNATDEQKRAWREADRYSLAEIAGLADLEAMNSVQSRLSAGAVSESLERLFSVTSNFSAAELAWTLRNSDRPANIAARLLGIAEAHFGEPRRSALPHGRASALSGGMQRFVCCRILHSLATALASLAESEQSRVVEVVPGLLEELSNETQLWLEWQNLRPSQRTGAREWAANLRRVAFGQINETILFATPDPALSLPHGRASALSLPHGRASALPGHGRASALRPRLALRPDETVWGRAPARLELGGGWTDTPPFTLEHGGAVINAAVNLNGQPPIHCYARISHELAVRLNSIDLGASVTIKDLDQLMDYRDPEDGFALVKAALAIAGFSPAFGDWPEGISLREILKEFGGGLEITTLAGIPKGSGLGASSIVGAAVVGVIHRVLGRPVDRQRIFREVLRLEQALTTGGGWQDQAGGGFEGTKLTTTQPGLHPTFRPNFVPSDVLDPRANGGSTLLYYTGLTRLAKNILEQIVGGYLDRDRAIMQSLADEFKVAEAIYGALSRKDAAEFGYCLNEAWRLQKQLCPDVTNEAIEDLLARIGPRIHGARILGAGSGGFMLMIAKSPRAAAAIRDDLLARPLNDQSRFFEYDISNEGLVVTTC
jgi:galactokinase/mevalonate kinase-like predicted kinase